MGRASTLKEMLPGFGRVAARFWPYTRKQWPMVAGSVAALFAQIALRALEPWPLKFVFDHILQSKPGRQSSGISLIDNLETSHLLAVAAIGVVAIIGLRAFASYLCTVGFALVGNRVLTEVRADLYRHLQLLSLSFHNSSRGGDLVLRVIGDIGMLKDVAVTALLPLAANVLVLFSMVGLMFLLNWKLALVALAVTPLFWLASARLSRRIRDVSRDQRKREGAMASTAAESIGAIRVVKALSLEENFAHQFSGQNNKSLKDGVRASRLAASLERTVDLLIALATALVLWFGARLTLRGEITPGDLLVFLAYLKNAFKPVQDFAKYTGRLAKATAAGERVIEILDRVPEVRDLPGAVVAPRFTGNVTFTNLSFAYEKDHPVLQDINLDVKAGQTVALVGASGNGKSTLVSLLIRLYDPDSGQVLIDGRDTREFTCDSLRAQVSVVLQDTLLFAASVRENIAYGAVTATPEDIEQAVRLANAHGFISRLPEGYETIVGERGVTLSAGQRQRIAIARAAVRRSPILILDEPTTGLDEENECLVFESLKRLAQGRTAFLITHNLIHASQADLVVLLAGGRVIELGKHEELIRRDGTYAALFRKRSSIGRLSEKEGDYAFAI
jgi:ATP-binding cassette, subfamily B, bacterial